MAKDNKKAAQAAAEEQKTAQVANTETTMDNIEDQIKEGNKMEENLVAEVEEQIKKEKDDIKKRQLKEVLLESEFITKREVLALRRERDEAKARKEAVKAMGEAKDDLKAGKITPNEYEKKVGEAVKERQKAFDEIRTKHEELVKELRNGFPNSYSCEWEYERWTNGIARNRFNW